MIVTPRDYDLAIYSIKSLSKIIQIENLFIKIYANGLGEQEEKVINKIIQNWDTVVLGSNKCSFNPKDSKVLSEIGKTYITDKGRSELRVGDYESAPEIWERELLKLDTELVGIIDPDFEIFNKKFIEPILFELANNSKVGFHSTDFTETRDFFNTHKTKDKFYSKQKTILIERYHTWFCIYRKSLLEQYSDFSYYEKVDNNKHYTYDHSAKLQEDMKLNCDVIGASLDSDLNWCYLHFSGFSNNNTLKGVNLFIYRIIRIGIHNGYIHFFKFTFISKIIIKLSKLFYNFLKLNKYDIERTKFSWQ